MIKITSNLNDVISNIVGRMISLQLQDGPTVDKMVRTAAFDVLPRIKKRIHVDGLNSKEEKIGTYSNSYINYRKKNKRGSSTKVIFSLTRQMENDFSVIAGRGGSYGLGFKNKLNYDKSEWLQKGSKPHTVKEHIRIVGKKSQIKEIKVKSHTRKGTKGFGVVYKPTEKEVEVIKNSMEFFVKKLLEGNQ